jgi:regulator of telomere elongation helicase 1
LREGRSTRSEKPRCEFFQNQNVEKLLWEPLDIEDLHKEAHLKSFCPFYAMKDRAKDADIILMPYNYMIDYHIREMFTPNNYENSIIIFDEAHNVTKVAEDASSYDIKENDIV